jgi:hypothetical protein
MKTSSLLFLGAAAAFAAFAVEMGCGADDCTPGRQTSCACPGGKAGVQLCSDDGSFAECDCSGGDGGGPTSTTTTGGGGSGASGGGGSGGTCAGDICGGECVDTMTSNEHCGRCDNPCPMNGSSCQGGQCECMGALEFCVDACIDVSADDTNCGACGHDCLGGTCVNGRCPTEVVVQLGGNDDAYAVAVDATYAYVAVDGPQPRVVRQPLGGGMVELVLGGQARPRQLVLDGTDLYFTNFGTAVNAQVVKVDTLMLGSVVLADTQPTGVWGLAVGQGFAYWANQNANTISRISTTPPAVPQPLATVQSQPWEVAVDASFVYWTNYVSGDVRRIPINGGMSANIATGQSHPLGLALDATHVYWTNETSGEVKRAELDGSNPEVLAMNQSQPTYLVVDGGFVYWTNFASGGVMRLDVSSGGAGSDPLALAVGQNQPYDVTTDASYVYWTTLDGGAVARVPK